jgi:DNA-binding Xre family transcriptional regulator
LISYKPLKLTLVHKGMKITDLETIKGGPLNGRTVSKLRNDQTMNIESIAKICMYLDVPIEKVVEVVRDGREDRED